MANYLVASGSRKISQLEIATNPVPAGSSSIMPLVIGDAIPITNGTTVQITPDNFLSNLVFDANETYTGGNTFSGTNTFSAINTFTANNIFSGVNNFSGSSTVFNIASSSVNYQTAIQGGEIELFDGTVGDTLRIKIYSGDGVKFEDFGGSTYGTFMEVGTQKGEITLKRNTTIEGNLTVNEVFYVYETSSILTSSGSTQFGDSIDDTHLFTGSIKITGSLNIVDGGLIDGVDVSVFKSDYDTASGSFSTRVSTNETNISQNTGDITLLSSSYETFSGSQYQTDSGSFSIRVTNNEVTGSDHEDRIVKGTNSVTSSAISSSYIDLDVLPNGDIPAHKAGRLFFGSEDGALEVYNEEADITLQVGQEFWIRTFNKSGAVIENGTPVFASGSQGDRVGIYPATAESHSGVGFYDFDNHIIGIATHQIGISEEGYVTSQGIVRGVDTQNFDAGDLLFLQTGSPATVADYYRNTPPPYPYDTVQVGYVARSAANGFIFAEPKEPIHFGIISGLSGSTNQEPGDLWVYQENGSFTTTHTLTGSYTLDGNIEGGQFTGSFSGSFEGDGTNITGVTASDVDFDNITNKPTLVSQSQQIDATNVTNFDSEVLTYIDSLGVFSGSEQVDADTVTNFDSNVLTYNNSLGVVSSSQQIDADNVTNFDSNVLTYVDSLGVVSSSQQIDADNVTNFDSNVLSYVDSLGVVSGSEQVDADNVTNFDPNVLTYINSLGVVSGSVIGSIFRQTGSYYSTANDLQITGSVVVSTDITASKLLLNKGGNTFIGDRVGTQLDTVSSDDNVAIGTDALGGQSAVGSQNVDSSVAIGVDALQKVQTGGTQNVGIGYRALFDNTSGDNNAAVGIFAGSNITIGDRNTTLGSNSGLDITSGNGNTTVGYLANVQNATDFNSIVIGSGSVGNGSNTVVIGNDNVTSTELKGNVTASGAISASGELVGTSLNLRTYNETGGGRVKNYSNTTNYYNALTASAGGIVLGNGTLYPNAVYLFTIGNENLFADSDVNYFRASTTIFTGPESGSVWGTFVDVPTTTGGPTDTTVGVTPHNGTGVRVKITNGPDFDAGTETVSLRITATMLSEIDM